MQFSTIFTVLAAAMTATALPNVARSGGDETAVCSSTHNNNVCCDGLLNCVLNVVAENCSNDAYCCKSDAVQVSSLLNQPLTTWQHTMY